MTPRDNLPLLSQPALSLAKAAGRLHAFFMEHIDNKSSALEMGTAIAEAKDTIPDAALLKIVLRETGEAAAKVVPDLQQKR